MTPVALVHTAERKQLRHLSPADAQVKLIDMWLYGKAVSTQQAYRRYITRFLAFTGKPLASTTLEDLYEFGQHLEQQKLAPNTQKVHLNATKSLLSFAQKVGLTKVNAGAPMTIRKGTDNLCDRLLEEVDIAMMVRLEPDNRNRCILQLLYGAGLRAAELCALKWKNLTARGSGGQVTVLGKGGKTRSVLLPAKLWNNLLELKGDAPGEAPVFPSNKTGGHLHRQNLDPIIKRAAQRAGLSEKVSAHWLRHSHATHSLEKGANIALVSKSLGHSSVAVTDRYLHTRPDDSSAMYLSTF